MANEHLIECYGKRKKCAEREKCPLGEPCLSKARESLDEFHFQKQNLLLGDVLFAPQGQMNESDILEMPEYDTDEDSADKKPEPIRFGDLSIPAEIYPQVLEIIGRTAKIYFTTPKLFDALMHKVFKGKNQADFAKEKDVSRQYVSREMLKEVGIAQKRHDVHERKIEELNCAIVRHEEKETALANFMSGFTDKERFVYVHFFLNGETIKSISMQMGMHRNSITAIVHKVRSKISKNCASQNGISQKS